jgi:hypothetical protein
VTLYVVVDAGLTKIELLVAPVDQTNEPPTCEAVAVKFVDVPEQMVALFTNRVGAGLTVTVPEEVAGVQVPKV